jgi:hypothetical protein
MQQVVVISYRPFGTTDQSHPQGSTGSLNPEDGINRLSETCVRSYHYSLNNNPENTVLIYFVVDGLYQAIT